MSDNPFWQFSLGFYAEPQVAEACLQLQNELNQDVNLILYALWLAQQNRALTEQHQLDIQELVQPWREQVLLPIRQLRISLRGVEEAAEIREQIKSAELQAERRQQDAMWQYYQSCETIPRLEQGAAANIHQLERLGGESSAWQVLLTAFQSTGKP